jgi:hypothetical protein
MALARYEQHFAESGIATLAFDYRHLGESEGLPETLIDPVHAEDVASSAPRGEARYYDGDHFEVYHQPLLEDLLTDQTAFLRKHLHVDGA